MQYITVPVEDILLPLSAVAASGAAHHPLRGQGFYPASLAARADQLCAHIAKWPHDAVINAIAEESGQEDPTVAAMFVFQFGRGSGSHGKPQGGRGGPSCSAGRGGNAAAGAAAGADKSSPSYSAETHRSGWTADSLLGRKEDHPGIPWTRFRLDLPPRRHAVPDYRCRFFWQNRLLVDPAANCLVDTLSFKYFLQSRSRAARFHHGRPRRRCARSHRPGFQESAEPPSRAGQSREEVATEDQARSGAPHQGEGQAKAEFDQLEREGIIRRSDSPGPFPCTWSGSRMAAGGPAAITVG